MGRVKRPVQRIIIVALALMLVVPIGIFGVTQFNGGDGDQEPSAGEETTDTRPTVDPAEQPPRPEIAAPEPPAAMAEQTTEGAEATLTFLLESYTYMMTTGDTSLWESSIDESCDVCHSFLSNAQLLDEQGGYLVDGEFTVESATFEGAGDPPASGSVTADFTQDASTLVDDPSRTPYELDPVSGQLQASILWDGERWRITDMTIAPDEAPGRPTPAAPPAEPTSPRGPHHPAARIRHRRLSRYEHRVTAHTSTSITGAA